MKTPFRLIWIVLVVVALVACNSAPNPTQAAPASTKAGSVAATQPGAYPAPQTGSTPQSPQTGSTPQSPQVIQPVPDNAYPAQGGLQIVKSDGAVAVLALDALKALPAAKVNLEGQDENGRKLVDALKLAGVTTFNKISVVAPGGTTVLPKDKAEQTYLDISADGKIRVMTQGVARNTWPSAVTSFKVE